MSSALIVAVLVLVAVHLTAGAMRFLDGVPRSRWLSAAGGVSVAYVLVHLLPELARYQELWSEGDIDVPWFETEVYVVALSGLVAFYGLEIHTRGARKATSETGRVPTAAFVVSVSSYALYNLIVGYLLVERATSSVGDLLLFTLAMGLHFVVNDFGLREHDGAAYVRYGRWVLAAAVVAGTALGLHREVPVEAVAVLLALLGGGVILNVLKEELPAERDSRFLPFVAGAALYAWLLLQLG